MEHSCILPSQRPQLLPAEDRPLDGSSLGDGVPSTVHIQESTGIDERSLDDKSITQKKPKAVLQFALNNLNTADYPSFVKQRESTLTFPEKVR